MYRKLVTVPAETAVIDHVIYVLRISQETNYNMNFLSEHLS